MTACCRRSLARVSSRGTPVRITIFTAIVTSVFAGLIPLDAIAALANAGTLAAFVAVCAAMLVLRVREPDRERKFRAPAAWLVGIVGILGCLYLFISLPHADADLLRGRASNRPVALCHLRPSRGGKGEGGCADHAAASSRQRLTNIVGGSAGNLVEWFDWYVYAAFALYFAPSFFPEGRSDRAAAVDRRRVRGRLRHAADRRLDHGHLRRPSGAQGRPDAVGQPDVPWFAGDRRGADLRPGRAVVAGDPDRRANGPGPQPWRRIWLQRDLSQRDGRIANGADSGPASNMSP